MYNGNFIESLDSVYYCIFFQFLTVKELNTERHFIVWSAMLIQHEYYEAILTSEFGSKDMMLWKRGSSFVFSDDETLWIVSIPIWYDRPCTHERLL